MTVYVPAPHHLMPPQGHPHHPPSHGHHHSHHPHHHMAPPHHHYVYAMPPATSSSPEPQQQQQQQQQSPATASPSPPPTPEEERHESPSPSPEPPAVFDMDELDRLLSAAIQMDIQTTPPAEVSKDEPIASILTNEYVRPGLPRQPAQVLMY